MKPIVTFGLLLCVMQATLAQQPQSRPQFSDYGVDKIYQGKPAPPVLSKEQRRFRTMIREGARSKVEFAGHYTLPRFGCGAGCTDFYIVDSISGKVYGGFGVAELPFAWQEKHGPINERLEFRANSRLLRITGCPNETNCGFYDYEMVDGVGLKLIRKELLPKEYQY